MRMGRLTEIREELRDLFGTKAIFRFLDAVLPLTGYFIVEYFAGVPTALLAAVIGSALVAVYRLVRKESLAYILLGAGGVLLSVVLVRRSGSGVDFYLPGLTSSALTVIICLVSVAFNRPWIAYTSWVMRRWPMAWYWHPQVVPAYKEVTFGWAAAYLIRLGLEYWLFRVGNVTVLGTVRLLFGWPFILALLIASYLYGIARLKSLRGPSVNEFKEGKLPPWEGQQRGF